MLESLSASAIDTDLPLGYCDVRGQCQYLEKSSLVGILSKNGEPCGVPLGVSPCK